MQTVEELVEAFLNYHRDINHSDATIRHYADSLSLLQRCLKDEGIEPIAASLIPQTFNTFAGWLRTTPTRQWRGKTNRSIHGIHGALKDCKAWLRWLEGQELILKAPKVPVPKLPQNLFPILTDDDLAAIFSCSQLSANTEIAIRNRALIAFLLDTGVRLSESSGLTMADLDLKEGAAVVTGKGRKQRMVFFSGRATEAMRRWLAIRGDEEGEVFWLSPAGIRMVMERIKKETGLEVLHTHQFRHTAFTMMVKSGADLHTIKRIAGHASVTTTESYLALAGADIKEKHTNASPFDNLSNKFESPKPTRRRLRNA